LSFALLFRDVVQPTRIIVQPPGMLCGQSAGEMRIKLTQPSWSWS
jgi:hypothetical protein